MSGHTKELLELYLRFYESEFEAREELGSSLAPFISGLTLLAAGALYLVSVAPDGSEYPLVADVFWFATIVGGVSLVFGIGLVLAALWSRTYSHVPGLFAIEKWRSDNQAYHEAHPEERPTLDERLNANLCAVIAEAASENRTINRARANKAHYAKLATAVALAALFVSATIQASTAPRSVAGERPQIIITGAPDDR